MLPRPLFFNWAQSRFVVIELKIGPFQPEHTGKLGFYLTWVNTNLRQPDRHSPTIGILLCAGRNDSPVRYTLGGSTAPLAGANYSYDTLPAPPAPPSPPTANSLRTRQEISKGFSDLTDILVVWRLRRALLRQ